MEEKRDKVVENVRTKTTEAFKPNETIIMSTTPEGKIKEEIRDQNDNVVEDKLVDTDVEYNNKPDELNVLQECENCKKLSDPTKQEECLNGVCDKLPNDHPKKEDCKKEVEKKKEEIINNPQLDNPKVNDKKVNAINPTSNNIQSQQSN